MIDYRCGMEALSLASAFVNFNGPKIGGNGNILCFIAFCLYGNHMKPAGVQT